MNKQVKTYDGSFSGAVVGFWYNIFLFTFPFVQSYLLGIERVNANVWPVLNRYVGGDEGNPFVVLTLEGSYSICAMARGILESFSDFARPKAKSKDGAHTYERLIEVIGVLP